MPKTLNFGYDALFICLLKQTFPVFFHFRSPLFNQCCSTVFNWVCKKRLWLQPFQRSCWLFYTKPRALFGQFPVFLDNFLPFTCLTSKFWSFLAVFDIFMATFEFFPAVFDVFWTNFWRDFGYFWRFFGHFCRFSDQFLKFPAIFDVFFGYFWRFLAIFEFFAIFEMPRLGSRLDKS